MIDSHPFSPRAAYRLVLAGCLLQRRGTKVKAAAGETYPAAVLRAIESLPEVARESLRSEVDFLESLGSYGGPTDAIRKRWSGIVTEGEK
jgi:hypothetical protein